jgi:hypothetical protein
MKWVIFLFYYCTEKPVLKDHSKIRTHCFYGTSQSFILHKPVLTDRLVSHRGTGMKTAFLNGIVYIIDSEWVIVV